MISPIILPPDDDGLPPAVPNFRNYRLYCDESGFHGAPFYAFGALIIPHERRGDLTGLVKTLRDRHGFRHELKWSTVSRANADFACDIIRLVFERNWIIFNCLIVQRSLVDMTLHEKPILVEAAAGKKPTDRLVVEEAGRVPSRQRLYKAFVALERRVGLAPAWSFHALRHAFGTTAIRCGGNVEAVRELMGHKDLATTSRYLHALAEDRRSVIDAIDGQLAGNAARSMSRNG